MVGALDGERRRPRGRPRRWAGRSIPSALGDLLRGLHDAHHFPRYLITENGAAMADNVRVDGRVIDTDRLEYIAAHLGQVHQAMEDGVPVEGYFAWSLLDNFEWAHGYGPKFGLVAVDMETQTPHAQTERAVVRRGRPNRRDPRRLAQPSPRLAWAAIAVRRPGRDSMPRRMCRSWRRVSKPSARNVSRWPLSGGTLIRGRSTHGSSIEAVTSPVRASASAAMTGPSARSWATR